MKTISRYIMTLALLLSVATGAWADEPTSGTFGDNLNWAVTGPEDNLTLTIGGTGAMPDYAYNTFTTRPWNYYSSKVKNLVIGDGVTRIGDNCFYYFGALTGSLVIPGNVESIGYNAFFGAQPTSVTFSPGVKSIGESAFRNNEKLTSVTFGEGLETIGKSAFEGCRGLKAVEFPASIKTIESNAFNYADNIESYTFNGGVPGGYVNNTAFLNHKEGCIVRVPKSTTGWDSNNDGIWDKNGLSYGLIIETFASFIPYYDETVKGWIIEAMPASDLVLTPIYAPVAQWATESDVELLPTAAEGIFAGTTDPIIVEGTVAPGQGIVMYAVTSTNQATAPELSAFSATVPTAENIADEGADVLVWYYIKGADAPDGQEATAENTFNDSEICATPLEVSVLSNQFDITFNAANANTIESGKATVTVGGTAATVTEGKLEGVKMGSEVKLKAKEGYKFRKVEVKKKAAAAKTITIGDVELTYADGDTWEAIVSKNSDKIKTIAGGYIVQVAQPAPNQYRYIHVWYTGVKPSDIIDPSKNYQWGTMEVAW